MPTSFRCCVHMSAIALVATCLFASSAHAQEATPPPAAPAAMPAGPLFSGQHFGVGSSFGVDSTAVTLTGNTGSVLYALGLIYKYDGNVAEGMDKTSASGVLDLAYMVHNQFPFAMGPEVVFIPELAPKGFGTNVVQAGWAFWYAPWNIPAVIGTALFANIVLPDGGKAVVTTLTPAVRIVFGFK
jgi:hypothetical protein